MTDWPPVIIVLITYRRLALALETIRSAKTMIDYPNIGFHVADDGSGSDYVRRLVEEIGSSYSVTSTDAERAGVGRSMNLGIAAALSRADLWLHLEDDWVLPRPLDIRPCVRLLLESDHVGMVRLGRLSAGIKAEVIPGADSAWWGIDIHSDTYTFNGNPSLRHRRFHDAYGYYPEGLRPGETELAYCAQVHSISGPGIVYPTWLSTRDAFQHIGDHQSYKYYMEREGRSAEEVAAMFEAQSQSQSSLTVSV